MPAARFFAAWAFFTFLLCLRASAQDLSTCPSIPSEVPRKPTTCALQSLRRVTFSNDASSSGFVEIFIVRPNRTVTGMRNIKPGRAKGYQDICAGVQFYIRAAKCGKCIRVFTFADMSDTDQTIFIPDGFCQVRPAGDNRPNVIVAMADDIGSRDFGFFGGTLIQTPVIDRLARNSLTFLSSWATPLCRTTRGIIMTGKLPFETRWFDHKNPPPEKYKPYGPSFGNMAQQAGYKTLWVGKWQIFGKARGQEGYGFDNYTMWRHSDAESTTSLVNKYDGPIPPIPNDWGRYNHPLMARDDEFLDTNPLDFSTNIFLKDLLKFMRQNKVNGEKSFVYWPMTLAHKDWDFDKGEQGWVRMPILNAENEVIGYQPGKPSLKNMVEYLDTIMGLLIAGLKREGLYSDTVLIWCTDNGSAGSDETVNYKGKTRDERGVRVPVLIHGGGGRIAARVTRQMFSLVDVYATVAGFMKQSVASDLRNSVDFSEFALENKRKGPRRWSFSFLRQSRMIRTREWVYDADKVLYNCTSTTVIEDCPVIGIPDARRKTRKIRATFDRILEELETTGYSDPTVF